MRELEKVCVICQEPNIPVVDQGNFFCVQINCGYCGRYSINEDALDDIKKRPIKGPREVANARGWLRENRDIQIDISEINLMRSLATPSVGERAEKLLIAFSKKDSFLGSTINVGREEKDAKAWVAFSWSVGIQELKYLLRDYMVSTKGWITDNNSHGDLMGFKIAPQGYHFLEQLRFGTVDKVSGFCAMWFDAEVASIWTDAIKPAIELAGYRSVRIDGVEHNNRIDDEILSNIRSSRFIVADFTGQRGGVYFEAGFALGLGLPVIWTVREDELSKVHFDNRQYNFIVWKADDLPNFAKRLQARIEATIGKGPVAISDKKE